MQELIDTHTQLTPLLFKHLPSPISPFPFPFPIITLLLLLLSLLLLLLFYFKKKTLLLMFVEMPHNIICGISWSLLLLMFSFSSVAAAAAEEENGMVPVPAPPMMTMMMMMNESSRRKLNRYQVCSLCTCCGRGYCLASPCCYAINCNIPNRPYGYCSFTPKACNCLGCHI